MAVNPAAFVAIPALVVLLGVAKVLVMWRLDRARLSACNSHTMRCAPGRTP